MQREPRERREEMYCKELRVVCHESAGYGNRSRPITREPVESDLIGAVTKFGRVVAAVVGVNDPTERR